MSESASARQGEMNHVPEEQPRQFSLSPTNP